MSFKAVIIETSCKLSIVESLAERERERERLNPNSIALFLSPVIRYAVRFRDEHNDGKNHCVTENRGAQFS